MATDDTLPIAPRRNHLRRLRSRLRELYYGHTLRARRYQAAMVALDVVIIVFFMVTKFAESATWFAWVGYGVAAVMALDLAAKAWATARLTRLIRYPEVWADVIVIATLILPFMSNWAFLRILRLWALVRRERFWDTLGGGRWDDTYIEDVTRACSNLVVLIFVSAGIAQAMFAEDHPQLNHFVDALYFAVTTLTTTGFGDITFTSVEGRLFSILLMLTGIMVFVRLAQAVVQPHRRALKCTGCGLDRHEADAKHCRRCGTKLPHARPLASRRERRNAQDEACDDTGR
jgi:voltage-gated potassium channel